MLSKRQSHIVDLLNNELKPITGRDLGKTLGVSDRTIRSDVEAINAEYGCELIRANRRSGYYIDHDLMKAQNISSQEVIPQTAQQRCVYLIKELLFRSREINLIDLQERVFVSGYSIDNDLRKIRDMIRRYPGLRLVRSRNHIRLSGDEGDKRKLYKELLMEETKGNFVNLSAIADIWKDFDLLKLEDDFTEICEKYDFRISEMEYPLIMLHAGVSIERMLNHNYVSEEPPEAAEEEGGKEYQIADELFARISEIYKVKLVKDEVLRFAGLLKGKDRLTEEETREEADDMERLMRRDLFHIRNSMESREAILNFLCDSLYEKGLSGENFKENVFRREALSGTSFVYGFAVPHAIEVSNRESCISIMILREPVKWGDFNVSLVVLLAIRDTDNSLLKVFFDWLCNIVTDNNKFQELIQSKNYEEFMNHVTR